MAILGLTDRIGPYPLTQKRRQLYGWFIISGPSSQRIRVSLICIKVKSAPLRYKCIMKLPSSTSHKNTPARLFVLSFAAAVALALTGCGSKEEAEKNAKASPNPADLAAQQPEVHGPEIKSVQLTHPLNQEWVAAGKATYEAKCLPCHKLTGEKLVGPGWLGVTKRREPVWIMNMVTNVDMMLEKDPEAQKLLELCLVRMHNLSIQEDEARKIIEFMRSNDGEP